MEMRCKIYCPGVGLVQDQELRTGSSMASWAVMTKRGGAESGIITIVGFRFWQKSHLQIQLNRITAKKGC